MRARTLPLIICLAVAPTLAANAQEPESRAPGSRTDPEELSASEWNEQADAWRLERFNEMLENPLDLNTALYGELLAVPGFDRELALRILDRRERIPFRTVNDLLKVDGVSEELLERAAPFIAVKREDTLAGAVRSSGAVRSRAQAALWEEPPAEDQGIGSRWKLVDRVMFECVSGQLVEPHVTLGGGLVVEKDAGERRLADHVGGFLDLKLWGRALELAIGDYSLETGMGLAFGSRGSTGKSADVLGPSRWRSFCLKCRASSSESGGLRGIALAYRSGALEAAVIYSNRALHARLDESSVVTSFYEAGLFRTPAEESMRFRTRERVLGLSLSAQLLRGLHIGATFSESKFLHDLEIRARQLQGRRFALFSVGALGELGGLRLATEAAWDGKGSSAANLALEARISRAFSAAVSVRRAQHDFVSLHGYGFADKAGTPAGEKGAYLGIRFRAPRGLSLAIFVDQFAREATGSDAFQSAGSDLLAYARASLNARLGLELSARRRLTASDGVGTDALGRRTSTDTENSRNSFRATVTYTPAEELRLKSRFEVLHVRPGSTDAADRGFAMTHEVSWTAKPWLALGIRAATFETDSYEARLYVWESTVRGALVQNVSSGSGFRWSASGRVSAGRAFTAEAVYTETSRMEAGEPNGRLAPGRSASKHFTAQLEIRF